MDRRYAYSLLDLLDAVLREWWFAHSRWAAPVFTSSRAATDPRNSTHGVDEGELGMRINASTTALTLEIWPQGNSRVPMKHRTALKYLRDREQHNDD